MDKEIEGVDERPAYDTFVKIPTAPLPLSDVLVYLKQMVQGQIIEHKQYTDKHSKRLPEILNWKRSNPQ
jgi:phosphoketolase